jgi:hypothetical protein
LLPPEKVDEVVEVRPKGCSRCGGALERREEGPAAWRHQVVELPEVKPRVTEHQLCYGQWYHQWRQGTLPRPAFQLRMSEVEAAVARLLRRAQVCPDQKVAGMAQAIIKLEPALWAFVHMEQVEPTNNRAERALRPAVCMRKGSFGTHSPEGSRYIERMLTAVTRSNCSSATCLIT